MPKLIHTWRRKQGGGGLMTVKIDMEKAYDKVDWAFMLEVLKFLGSQLNRETGSLNIFRQSRSLFS